MDDEGDPVPNDEQPVDFDAEEEEEEAEVVDKSDEEVDETGEDANDGGDDEDGENEDDEEVAEGDRNENEKADDARSSLLSEEFSERSRLSPLREDNDTADNDDVCPNCINFRDNTLRAFKAATDYSKLQAQYNDLDLKHQEMVKNSAKVSVHVEEVFKKLRETEVAKDVLQSENNLFSTEINRLNELNTQYLDAARLTDKHRKAADDWREKYVHSQAILLEKSEKCTSLEDKYKNSVNLLKDSLRKGKDSEDKVASLKGLLSLKTEQSRAMKKHWNVIVKLLADISHQASDSLPTPLQNRLNKLPFDTLLQIAKPRPEGEEGGSDDELAAEVNRLVAKDGESSTNHSIVSSRGKRGGRGRGARGRAVSHMPRGANDVMDESIFEDALARKLHRNDNEGGAAATAATPADSAARSVMGQKMPTVREIQEKQKEGMKERLAEMKSAYQAKQKSATIERKDGESSVRLEDEMMMSDDADDESERGMMDGGDDMGMDMMMDSSLPLASAAPAASATEEEAVAAPIAYDLEMPAVDCFQSLSMYDRAKRSRTPALEPPAAAVTPKRRLSSASKTNPASTSSRGRPKKKGTAAVTDWEGSRGSSVVSVGKRPNTAYLTAIARKAPEDFELSLDGVTVDPPSSEDVAAESAVAAEQDENKEEEEQPMMDDMMDFSLSLDNQDTRAAVEEPLRVEVLMEGTSADNDEKTKDGHSSASFTPSKSPSPSKMIQHPKVVQLSQKDELSPSKKKQKKHQEKLAALGMDLSDSDEEEEEKEREKEKEMPPPPLPHIKSPFKSPVRSKSKSPQKSPLAMGMEKAAETKPAVKPPAAPKKLAAIGLAARLNMASPIVTSQSTRMIPSSSASVDAAYSSNSFDILSDILTGAHVGKNDEEDEKKDTPARRESTPKDAAKKNEIKKKEDEEKKKKEDGEKKKKEDEEKMKKEEEEKKKMNDRKVKKVDEKKIDFDSSDDEPLIPKRIATPKTPATVPKRTSERIRSQSTAVVDEEMPTINREDEKKEEEEEEVAPISRRTRSKSVALDEADDTPPQMSPHLPVRRGRSTMPKTPARSPATVPAKTPSKTPSKTPAKTLSKTPSMKTPVREKSRESKKRIELPKSGLSDDDESEDEMNVVPPSTRTRSRSAATTPAPPTKQSSKPAAPAAAPTQRPSRATSIVPRRSSTSTRVEAVPRVEKQGAQPKGAAKQAAARLREEKAAATAAASTAAPRRVSARAATVATISAAAAVDTTQFARNNRRTAVSAPQKSAPAAAVSVGPVGDDEESLWSYGSNRGGEETPPRCDDPNIDSSYQSSATSSATKKRVARLPSSSTVLPTPATAVTASETAVAAAEAVPPEVTTPPIPPITPSTPADDSDDAKSTTSSSAAVVAPPPFTPVENPYAAVAAAAGTKKVQQKSDDAVDTSIDDDEDDDEEMMIDEKEEEGEKGMEVVPPSDESASYEAISSTEISEKEKLPTMIQSSGGEGEKERIPGSCIVEEEEAASMHPARRESDSEEGDLMIDDMEMNPAQEDIPSTSTTIVEKTEKEMEKKNEEPQWPVYPPATCSSSVRLPPTLPKCTLGSRLAAAAAAAACVHGIRFDSDAADEVVSLPKTIVRPRQNDPSNRRGQPRPMMGGGGPLRGSAIASIRQRQARIARGEPPSSDESSENTSPFPEMEIEDESSSPPPSISSPVPPAQLANKLLSLNAGLATISSSTRGGSAAAAAGRGGVRGGRGGGASGRGVSGTGSRSSAMEATMNRMSKNLKRGKLAMSGTGAKGRAVSLAPPPPAGRSTTKTSRESPDNQPSTSAAAADLSDAAVKKAAAAAKRAAAMAAKKEAAAAAAAAAGLKKAEMKPMLKRKADAMASAAATAVSIRAPPAIGAGSAPTVHSEDSPLITAVLNVCNGVETREKALASIDLSAMTMETIVRGVCKALSELPPANTWTVMQTMMGEKKEIDRNRAIPKSEKNLFELLEIMGDIDERLGGLADCFFDAYNRDVVSSLPKTQSTVDVTRRVRCLYFALCITERDEEEKDQEAVRLFDQIMKNKSSTAVCQSLVYMLYQGNLNQFASKILQTELEDDMGRLISMHVSEKKNRDMLMWAIDKFGDSSCKEAQNAAYRTPATIEMVMEWWNLDMSFVEKAREQAHSVEVTPFGLIKFDAFNKELMIRTSQLISPKFKIDGLDRVKLLSQLDSAAIDVMDRVTSVGMKAEGGGGGSFFADTSSHSSQAFLEEGEGRVAVLKLHIAIAALPSFFNHRMYSPGERESLRIHLAHLVERVHSILARPSCTANDGISPPSTSQETNALPMGVMALQKWMQNVQNLTKENISPIGSSAESSPAKKKARR